METKRYYRSFMKRPGLTSFEVRHKETDLHIQAPRDMSSLVSTWIIELRSAIEEYASYHPGFLEATLPLEPDPLAPEPVAQMMRAAQAVGVGPMAAVAGAIAQGIAQRIAKGLTQGEIIVENGGDTVIKVNSPITVSILAGDSPFSGRVGIRLNPKDELMAVCTSSGTVGHSKSFGSADAVTVISKDGALADAAATGAGNLIHSKEDLSRGIGYLKDIPGIMGAVIIKGDAIAAFGQLELIPV